MKRRSLILGAGACAVTVGLSAYAQSPRRRIAFLQPGTQSQYQKTFDAFRGALKDLGYVEGRDIAIEVRWGNGKMERVPSLAAELVALKPAVIVTASSAAVAAFQKATSTIPIVFATVFNPVEQGFVSSMQRPGGNITGILVYADLAAKVVELAREAFPQGKRLGIIIQPADPAHQFVLETFQSSAARFQFEPVVAAVVSVQDLNQAFAHLASRKVDALYLPDLAFSNSYRNEILRGALTARLPILSGNHETTEAGGFLSYGTAREENYRRAATMVDKILRGARPADLPVEQPDRFNLLVSRRTAKSIGVNVPALIMLRADKVID